MQKQLQTLTNRLLCEEETDATSSHLDSSEILNNKYAFHPSSAKENSHSNLGPGDVPSSGSAPQPPIGRPEFENTSPAVEEPESDSRAQQDAMMMKLMELNANLVELNNELLMQNTQLKKENKQKAKHCEINKTNVKTKKP